MSEHHGTVGRVIFNILFYALVVAIVGGAVLFAFSNNPEKSYFGYRLYAIKTPSMAPAPDGSSPPGGFDAGDMIIVKLANPESIQVGDIITYVPGSDPSVFLAHRVVRKLDRLNGEHGTFFITKGDANDSEDIPVKGNMVVGKKVLAIPKMGVVLQFIRENIVLSILIVVFGFGAVILLRMYFSKQVLPVPPEKDGLYIDRRQ